MSRLDDMIQELCPDGVEYRNLEDCCIILDSKRKPITKAKRVAGDFPYYGANGVQDYVNDYLFEGKFVLVGEDGSVLTLSGKPVVNWAEGKIWVNNHAHIISEKEGINLRYLFYYLQTVNITDLVHGNIPKLTGKDFKAIKTPIPPLEVQQEIVRLLDDFTAKTAELQAELNKEYEARKKQYEYYREMLLKNCSNSTVVRLGDICSVITKGTTPKVYTKTGVTFIKTEAISNAKIDPCKLSYIDYETNESTLKRSKLQENDLLITIAGATIGKCLLIPKWVLPANTNQALAIIRLSIGNPHYVLHVLQSSIMKTYIKNMVKGSAQPNLNLKQLNDFQFNFPSLESQAKIVDTLDYFNSICDKLQSNISIELESRQKQYEYYRDKLLTFKELNESEVN